MDKLVFPKLTGEESAYVCRTPWTPEIGEIMSRLARAKAQVEPGRPVFGTIVLDCDLVVFLKISDKLLAKRTALRNVSLADARNMEKQIEEEVGGSGIETLTLLVG